MTRSPELKQDLTSQPAWSCQCLKDSGCLTRWGFKTFPFFSRLRVVPHFSSGTVEQAKRERAWKPSHARKARRGGERCLTDACHLFSRGAIFTRARVSLALLSLRKNGGLLEVHFFSVLIASSDRPRIFGIFKKRKTWISSFNLKVSIVTAFCTIVVSQVYHFCHVLLLLANDKTWNGEEW